ncbi:MAG: multiphosphoryl transfer protein [Actinomycetota bacterium]|nr:multiphosphoryl transfer protein [Actinomycetota bacterium]
MVVGIPASPGLATGVARIIGRVPVPNQRGRDIDPAGTVERALDAVSTELTQLADRLRSEGHNDEAEIVAVGALIANDPVLRSQARDAAAGGGDAAGALLSVSEAHASVIESLGDATLKERAIDIRQVGRKAATFATGSHLATPATNGERLVLVAEELGPADIIGLQSNSVAAGVASRGGASSHAAIVARSLGIPLVLGVDRSILEVEDGTTLIVDGDAAKVTIHPSDQEIRHVMTAMDVAAKRVELLAQERSLPSATVDELQIALLCNVATPEEARGGFQSGAQGVGLLRTELPFLESVQWPTEHDHRRVLDPIFEQLVGQLVTVRVLDFGGDKLPPFLSDLAGDLRDLPRRGLPALLDTPDALSAQLRAILKAGARSRLRIMLPMVTSLRELAHARLLFQEAVNNVGVEAPALGIMIEVPSAALLADAFAQEVDFFSIGSNDLTQHVLGLNRRDAGSQPALAAHPSILTLIARVVRAGHAADISVGVCGEAAGDPLVLPLIIGSGIGSISVGVARLDEVRARVRRLSAEVCRDLFRQAVHAKSVDDVWDLVRAEALPSIL